MGVSYFLLVMNLSSNNFVRYNISEGLLYADKSNGL